MNLNKLIDAFNEHCASLGVNILKDDRSFLVACLNRLKGHDEKAILKAYVKKWLEAEENGLPGRKTANTAIREYVEKMRL